MEALPFRSRFYVRIGDGCSTKSNVKSGVPLGPALRSLQFVHFINDLASTLKLLAIFFADGVKVVGSEDRDDLSNDVGVVLDRVNTRALPSKASKNQLSRNMQYFVTKNAVKWVKDPGIIRLDFEREDYRVVVAQNARVCRTDCSYTNLVLIFACP